MDGRAVVYCEGCFGNEYGKTAHGLVRHSERYEVVAVIDSTLAGQDSGEIIDKRTNGIPVVESLAAVNADNLGYFVIGMATDGGTLPPDARVAVLDAISRGLNVDCGLHEFLSDDEEIANAAAVAGVGIRDVRKPRPRSDLHFFSGDILAVKAKRVAVLGTDCALGKRTTATLLVHGLCDAGVSAQLIGTGQTSWLQGVRYGFLLDSTVNDFVGGELEYAIVSADRNESPDVIVIEGQACLTHPAGSGGAEILSSGKPHGVVLQHAPARRTYSGYDDFPLAPPEQHIATMESLFGTQVIGVGINADGLPPESVPEVVADLERRLGIPCCDPLRDGVSKLVAAVRNL